MIHLDQASATHALYAAHQTDVQAGALHVLRDAVVLFLIIVFLVGAFVGFVAGRAVGRRQR